MALPGQLVFEEVKVLSATACRHLPASAIGRLGARPGQKNLLVRVVLRDLEKTLTNETANALRDRIYRALHQGTEYQMARMTPAPDTGATSSADSMLAA